MLHKTLLLLISAILVGFLNPVLAQSQTANEKLQVKFSATELEQMNDDDLAFWNYFVTDGFVVFDITKDPSKSDIETIEFSGDLDNINPLALGLLPEETHVQTLKLGDSGQGIMVLSRTKILAKMARKQK